MERRIRTLYIITIIAILVFLGMQVYWLYVRYGYSLNEYESALGDRIAGCLKSYNSRRQKTASLHDNLPDGTKDSIITSPQYSLSTQFGDTIKTTRRVVLKSYRFSAGEILGMQPGKELTPEQKKKALEKVHALVREGLEPLPDSMVFDVSGAKDDNEAWEAAKNVYTQRKCPFTVKGIDSVLRKADIEAKVRLLHSDSMVWNPGHRFRKSVLNPSVTMTVPYSQAEGRVVEIVCEINPFDVLPGMALTLVIAVLVSGFLIVCLVLQFSTALRLSRLNDMRNSFVTTMIHELKRPISTLKMCVSGLGNDKMLNDPATLAELLAASRTALDNLSAYFSKLRDITFNNDRQIPLDLRPVRLRALTDVIAAATVIPTGKTVVLKNTIDGDLEVSADRAHLYNILNNLIENAVKYSGDKVTVTVRAEKTGDTVRISVTDTGNGISARDLPHIFSRFYRGRASETALPGMGLGLAYVRLLVRAHGGDVTVSSVPGRGSCFTLTLPQ